MGTGEVDERFSWGGELEFIDVEEIVTVDVVVVMMQEVGAFVVLAFIFIELTSGDPEFEGVLAKGTEEHGGLFCLIFQPLARAYFAAIFLDGLVVLFRVDGGIGVNKGIGSEAGGAGEILRDGLLMFDRFDDMAFGEFAFKDIEVIGWGVFFGWGEIIFDTLV
ncbi:MAG: hypothetical protein GTO13_09145 [Proteobacteria bacterium]|nr:hypothetical protein [Pseudomonadota bacterium]